MNREEMSMFKFLEERIATLEREELNAKIDALAEHLGLRFSVSPSHWEPTRYEVYPIDDGRKP